MINKNFTSEIHLIRHIDEDRFWEVLKNFFLI